MATDGQWTFGGYTFGDGTTDIVQDLQIEAPERRGQAAILPQDHGGVGGDDFAGFRRVQIDLLINRTSKSAAQAAWLAWHALMQPVSADQELRWVAHDSVERLLYVRPEPLVASWLPGQERFRARARWVAYDPAMYAGSLTSETVAPYALSGGLSYAVTFPKVYGAAGSGGGVTVENVGNWPTWPRFTIEGPSSGSVNVLAIEDATNGNSIAFTNDGGLTISAGSTVVVDTHPARRTVQFTSGADRLSTVVDLGSWFTIPPGESEIRFRASGTTAGSTLTTELRSAWL